MSAVIESVFDGSDAAVEILAEADTLEIEVTGPGGGKKTVVVDRDTFVDRLALVLEGHFVPAAAVVLDLAMVGGHVPSIVDDYVDGEGRQFVMFNDSDAMRWELAGEQTPAELRASAVRQLVEAQWIEDHSASVDEVGVLALFAELTTAGADSCTVVDVIARRMYDAGVRAAAAVKA